MKTLEEGAIDQKDYFDIAIYAFNILKKMEDRSYLSVETVRETATYDYLITFLSASEKYIRTITDTDIQAKTITSFSVQFYDPLLTNYTHSLYRHFAQTDGNSIFLSKSLLDGTNINVPEAFLYDIDRLDGALENVLPTIIDSTNVGAQGDSYIRIRKAATRIHGFQEMIDPKNYRNYVQLPYQADIADADNLPLVDDSLMNIIKAQPISVSSSSSTPPPVSPILIMARSLFPNADNTAFIAEGDYLRIMNAPVGLNYQGSQYVIFMNALLDVKGSVRDISFVYNDRKFQYVSDPVTAQDFVTLTTSILGTYVAKIEKYFPATSPNDVIRIFSSMKRANIGDITFDL